VREGDDLIDPRVDERIIILETRDRGHGLDRLA
jgi:hypothetical protein